jgi:hypothetical protein
MTVLVATYTAFRFTVVNITTSVTEVTLVSNVTMGTIITSGTKVVYTDSDEGKALKLLSSADIS